MKILPLPGDGKKKNASGFVRFAQRNPNNIATALIVRRFLHVTDRKTRCLVEEVKKEVETTNISRPLVLYHGGKWVLAPWIISFIPKHRIYVELYGGGASVLLRKPRAWSEIYNDLDSDIVNLFRVIRNNANELREKLYLTPYSREEYRLAFYKTGDPLEKARRTIVRSFMGFGTNAILCDGSNHPGFRGNEKTAGKSPGNLWKDYPEALDAIIDRMRGVIIENKNALDLIPSLDSDKTVFYADPPYLPEVRGPGKDYRFEMTEEAHIRLAEILNKTKGAALVSGYDSELYNNLYKGWIRRKKTLIRPEDPRAQNFYG
jgi:DNA adenine methylase